MDRSYDCHLWRAALAQARAVREFCNQLPQSEWEDVVANLKAAAFSIPIEVAEASRHLSDVRYAFSLSIAQVYSAQVDCWLMHLRAVGVAQAVAVQPLLRGADEVARLLRLLKKGLHDPIARPKPVWFERRVPAWLEVAAPGHQSQVPWRVESDIHDESFNGGLQ
jgi:four helix bundle protein